MSEQTKIDNSLAIRLSVGSIKSLLVPRYVSKKEIRKALQTISSANNDWAKSEKVDSILRDTDDQEIKYFMEVSSEGRKNWREEMRQHSGIPEEIVESYMRETAEGITENFNATLRHGEDRRELVRVIKVITHERSL